MRNFGIGDRVICDISNVKGEVQRFYTPTGDIEEQTLVLCDDGRMYHAPTSTWALVSLSNYKREV